MMLRFAQSTQLLWFGQGPNKLSRWINLFRLSFRPSRRILGFDVQFLGPKLLLQLYHEVFAREEYLFSCDTEAPIILDCGANIGMATFFFKWLYPKSGITAFEPDPTTFQILRLNIQQNHLEDVTAHNVALWDQQGEISFYVPQHEPGSLRMSCNPSRAQGRQITVPSRRLSDYIEGPIDLLKLDVEGAEHRVICDLVQSGKIEWIRQMIVEYHHNMPGQPTQLADFLRTLENCGLHYQISSSLSSVTQRDLFQDIMVYACR
jgi:FkbM family methyltransferase